MFVIPAKPTGLRSAQPEDRLRASRDPISLSVASKMGPRIKPGVTVNVARPYSVITGGTGARFTVSRHRM